MNYYEIEISKIASNGWKHEVDYNVVTKTAIINLMKHLKLVDEKSHACEGEGVSISDFFIDNEMISATYFPTNREITQYCVHIHKVSMHDDALNKTYLEARFEFDKEQSNDL